MAVFSAIIVAVINNRSKKRDKLIEERDAETKLATEQRMKESLLTMKLMNANCQLTIGVAQAHKRGYPNGEIEEGLKMVNEAMEEYKDFHDKLAVSKLLEE